MNKNIILAGWWIIVFIALFASFEHWAKERYKDERHWFDKVEHTADTQGLDYLFVGTSRVYASIDQDVFAREMEKFTGKPVVALNMGRGYTTVAEYYFALRHFAENQPELFKKCVIFLESADGLPDARTWDSSWILPEVWTQYILPYLKIKDIVKLWQTDMSQETKYNITILWLTQGSRLLSFNWDIRKGVLKRGVRFMEAIYGRMGIHKLKASKSDQMVLPGGEDMDQSRIERARRLAIDISGKDMLNQKPADWDKSVLKDIVKLIQNYDGKVIIFDLPVCSIQAKPLRTTMRLNDKETFKAVSKEWKTSIIKADIAFTDEDFPDLWHIHESRREEFTTKIANEVVKKYY